MKFLYRHNWLLLFTFSTLFISCKRIRPEKPAPIPFEAAIVAPQSFINTPIYFPIEIIGNKINEKLPEVVFQDSSFANDGIKISVKRGDVNCKTSKGKIHFSIPLLIEIEELKDGFLAKTFGKKEKTRRFDFSCLVMISSPVSVSNNWKVTTKCALDSIQWISDPVIKIGPFSLNLKDKIVDIIISKQTHLLTVIDKEISDQINLKSTIAAIWEKLQRPICLRPAERDYCIVPSQMSIKSTPIFISSQGLSFFTQIKLNLACEIGEQVKDHKTEALPDLQIISNLNDSFRLSLLTTLSMNHLNKEFEKALKGKTFQITNDKTVKLKKIEVKPYGNALEIIAHIGGDLKGIVYLTGKLEYDSQTQEISLQSIDYDIHTEEILIQAADWFYHSDFTDIIKENLKFSIAEQIQSVPDIITSSIEKGKTGDYIQLTINKIEINVPKIIMQPDEIQILIEAKGRHQLGLEKI